MYRYHVVPLELSAKEQASSAMIAARVQGLLDHYAQQGWEFMHLEPVPVTVQPGCLATFAGGRPQVVFLPQLIFRLDENNLRQIGLSGGWSSSDSLLCTSLSKALLCKRPPDGVAVFVFDGAERMSGGMRSGR